MKVFLFAAGVWERTTALVELPGFFQEKSCLYLLWGCNVKPGQKKVVLCYSSFYLELITSVREEHSILKK